MNGMTLNIENRCFKAEEVDFLGYSECCSLTKWMEMFGNLEIAVQDTSSVTEKYYAQ